MERAANTIGNADAVSTITFPGKSWRAAIPLFVELPFYNRTSCLHSLVPGVTSWLCAESLLLQTGVRRACFLSAVLSVCLVALLACLSLLTPRLVFQATHLVVKLDGNGRVKRTFKYMCAILDGAWIVDFACTCASSTDVHYGATARDS